MLSCPKFHFRLHLNDAYKVKIQSRLVVIANGQFFERGMQVAPGALLDDGYFEVVCQEEMKLLIFFRNLPKVYWRKHIGIPGIQINHAKKV